MTAAAEFEWQIPHSARTRTNRQMRHMTRQLGRPVQLMRGYQHVGQCPS